MGLRSGNGNQCLSIDVASDSTLSFNNALNLDGVTLTKTGAGVLEINNRLTGAGGTLNIQQGMVSGHGAVGGDVSNDGGTISPGDNALGGNNAIPEPGSLVLLLLGMMALVSTSRRFRWN